jgi:hypothetical protein
LRFPGDAQPPTSRVRRVSDLDAGPPDLRGDTRRSPGSELDRNPSLRSIAYPLRRHPENRRRNPGLACHFRPENRPVQSLACARAHEARGFRVQGSGFRGSLGSGGASWMEPLMGRGEDCILSPSAASRVDCSVSAEHRRRVRRGVQPHSSQDLASRSGPLRCCCGRRDVFTASRQRWPGRMSLATDLPAAVTHGPRRSGFFRQRGRLLEEWPWGPLTAKSHSTRCRRRGRSGPSLRGSALTHDFGRQGQATRQQQLSQVRRI